MSFVGSVYIGDGVYLSFENGMIKLEAPGGRGNKVNTIYINGNTWRSLYEYAKQIGFVDDEED